MFFHVFIIFIFRSHGARHAMVIRLCGHKWSWLGSRVYICVICCYLICYIFWFFAELSVVIPPFRSIVQTSSSFLLRTSLQSSPCVSKIAVMGILYVYLEHFCIDDCLIRYFEHQQSAVCLPAFSFWPARGKAAVDFSRCIREAVIFLFGTFSPS